MILGLMKKFGGMSAMARALGHKYPTTVQGWKDSGAIPHWRFASVIAAAKAHGVELSKEELAHLGQGQEAAAEIPESVAKFDAASAILRSENRYRALIEQALDMICVCAHGKVTFINAAGIKMLGATSSNQIIGHELIKLVHSDYQDIIAEGLENFIDEGTVVRLKFVRLDKQVIDVEIAVMSIGSFGEKSFMMEAHDITEQVRVAATLRKAHHELEQRVEERTRELTEEIAERRRAEEKLELSAKVIANLNEAVVIVDTDFRVISVNPAFSQITGYSINEVMGDRPHFHAAITEDPEFRAKLNDSLDRKGSWEGEFWCKHKNGNDHALRLSLSAISDDLGEAQKYVAVLSDITKRKQDEERIHFQANFDALTGLPNRSLFHDRLNQSLPTMERSNSKLGLMFIDLDGFKLVNDTLGHDRGDLLLIEASKRLTNCIRSGDTVARLGGDEFTVIMPNLTDSRNAPLLGQRILDALSEPFDLNGQEAFISGSIGITIFPDDAKDATSLIKNADAAMYRAKDQGKANFQFFTADLNEDVKERLFLKNNLSKALERDEFVLHYQPKLNIQSGAVTSCEALMRWVNDNMGGMVSPVRFIPIIEETGQVVEIGEWALWTACEQHKAWCAEGLPPIRIAVNLSARQLREPDFV
ncbi:MAG TPA: bifunctional diguanylate cyclase/phosphodiesterase, partial [Rhodospirillales bacterium]|nr:bifunctional diguanylate cyclase/phosphodiesterase [Rhodospirillales bacterium]